MAFVEYVKRNVTGAADSKVIVTGGNETQYMLLCCQPDLFIGSYGGTLAMSLRTKRPETFYGSLASSPTVESWGGSDDNPDKYKTAEWVRARLRPCVEAQAHDGIGS